MLNSRGKLSGIITHTEWKAGLVNNELEYLADEISKGSALASAGRFFIAEPPAKPFKMVCVLLQKLTIWGGRKKGGLGGRGHGWTYG